MNGINKISGEFYHLVYHSVYGIRACSLRLTNTYGPRQLIRHNRQGFIGWFMRQVVLGETIQLFGDGAQRRDFDYVDDVVDAFLRAGALEQADGQVFNLGGGGARLPARPGGDDDRARRARVLLAGALPGRAQEDRHRRLLRATPPRSARPWAGRPQVPLREGLARTIEYYREHQEHYL